MKVIKRFKPYHYWQINELENWYKEMAQEGLHIHKVGSNLDKFVKGEKGTIMYKVIPLTNKDLSSTQKDTFAKQGLSYIDSVQYFHLFKSDTQSGSSVQDEYQKRSEQLLRVERKVKFELWMILILWLLIIVFQIYILRQIDTYFIELIEGSAVYLAVLILLLFPIIFQSIKTIRYVRRMRDCLVYNKPFYYVKERKKYQFIGQVISILCVSFVAIIPVIQLLKAETETLAKEEGSFPIVRLSTIEDHSDYKRNENSIVYSEVDWSNHYEYQWRALAPIHYQSEENGRIPTKKWADGSGVYEPFMSTEVYQLRFSAMGKPLIADMMESSGLNQNMFKEQKHRDLDYLLFHRDGNIIYFYAQKANGLMYVRYQGEAEPRVVLEQIVQKLTGLQNGE